jgi:uncharacterized repeat protein (TIGR03987 family)
LLESFEQFYRQKPWGLFFFWGGLFFDTTGTGMMRDMAGGLTFYIHGVTGVLVILLMIIHAIWATIVPLRKNEQVILTFHRFIVVVWLFRLAPTFTGFFISIHIAAGPIGSTDPIRS